MKKETPEDRTLIRFIDKGMYDLCVDTGDEVIQMTDEVGFERSRGLNTKFVMRVVLTEKAKRKDFIRKKRFNTYRCPRCKKETKVEQGSASASIDWYDFLFVDYYLSRRTSKLAAKCQ